MADPDLELKGRRGVGVLTLALPAFLLLQFSIFFLPQKGAGPSPRFAPV